MGIWDSMKGPKPLKLGRWTKVRTGKSGTDGVWMRQRGIANTTSKGRMGEDVALEWLLQKGLKLLERNWHCGHKEVDLIMEGYDGLHFVEVRSRGLGMMQAPVQTVNAGKRHRIVAAADAYLKKMESGEDVHFDIVAVYCDDVTGKVMHTEYFPDAFVAV